MREDLIFRAKEMACTSSAIYFAHFWVDLCALKKMEACVWCVCMCVRTRVCEHLQKRPLVYSKKADK